MQAARDDGAGPSPAVLAAAPNALNFGAGTTTQTLVLSNGGSEALNVTAVNVTPAASWLTVTAPTAANGLGTYTLTVNRGTLAPGAYNTSLQIVSTANTVTVPVTMQVVAGGGTSPSANLGVMYVLLVNPDTLTGVDQFQATATNGVYNFQFTNVPAGTYLVMAGSDPDNDDRICNVGEACGAYLTLDEPVRITVNGNRSGVNFMAGFMTSIGAGAASWNPLARNASTPGVKQMKVPGMKAPAL